MAFPTSPSNNQVHKEGNRAFVYDSTLGTWDQVRETDRTAHVNNITSGTLGSGVTFPAGHVVQTVTATQAAQVNFGGGAWITITGMVVQITPKFSNSKILVTFNAGGSAGDGSEGYIYSLISRNPGDINAHYNSQGYGHHTSGSWLSIPIIVRCVDLPATTNTLTYQLKMRTTGGSTSGAVINYGASAGVQEGVSTAMEIKV